MADRQAPIEDAATSAAPSLAQAAQIPLQTFAIPNFPPEASNLRALTLTADVKLDEYQPLLSMPFALIPELPTSIQSLTLELFSLGFPDGNPTAGNDALQGGAKPGGGWLSQLSRRLPDLRALTMFSCLIDGLGEGSRTDAEEFFRELVSGKSGGLREIHLIDAFSRPGLFTKVGGILQKGASTVDAGNTAPPTGLQFLEISYTYRGHSDPDFLGRIPGDELPSLLVPSLVAVSLSISPSPPPDKDDPSAPAHVDEEGNPIKETLSEGVMPLNKRWTIPLMGKLVKEEGRPKDLKMLDLTLYTLDTAQIREILKEHKGLALLSMSVLVEVDGKWRESLLDALAESATLEILEIVGVPSVDFFKQVTPFPLLFQPYYLGKSIR